MRTMPDEVLMAYVDGELDPATRESVSRAVASDPALRARAEAFLMTKGPLANLFSSPMREPVPDRLLSLVMTGAGVAAPTQTKKPVEVSRKAVGEGLWEYLLGGLATPRFASAFAAVVLVGVGVGFGVGWSLTKGPVAETSRMEEQVIALAPGGIIAGGDFGRALEVVASKQPFTLAEGGGSGAVLKPFLSFISAKDGFCRLYELESSMGAYAGLACRGGDGAWHIRMHAPTVARPPYKHGDYQLSERNEPIDVVVGRMIVGDVMSVQREAELIKNGWKREN